MLWLPQTRNSITLFPVQVAVEVAVGLAIAVGIAYNFPTLF